MLLTRLFALVLAIQSVYQLFSLTYEALFLTFLALTLSSWLYMEHVQVTTLLDLNQIHLHEKTRQRFVINSDDLKRALAFLTFTIGEFVFFQFLLGKDVIFPITVTEIENMLG